MAAKVIYRSKDKNVDIKKIANEIKEHIANYVSAQSVRNNVVECKVEVSVIGHGIRPFGKNEPNDYIDLSVNFNGHEWDGLGSCDVLNIANEIERWAKTLAVDVEKTNLNYTFDPFHTDGEFPTYLRFFSEGCKEFNELRDFVMRYGINLGLRDLYNVRLFGKRGQYGESGERDYIAYNPNECKRLLEMAKKGCVEVKTLDDIENLDESIRYETECYGYRKVTLMRA